MTPEGHNDLFPALEQALKEASEPMDCNQLFEMAAIRSVAPSVNRVSDYLGVLWRRGLVSRIAGGSPGTRTRWKYLWRHKEAPAWKKAPPSAEVIDFRPKAILDRPNIYIAENGDFINIELPNLSINIKKK